MVQPTHRGPYVSLSFVSVLKRQKSKLFVPCLTEILAVGGGDRTNLTCLGELHTEETRQLKSLADSLGSCEKNIEMSCGGRDLQRINMTEVEVCKTAMSEFKTKVQSCMNKSGCEACRCWHSPKLSSSVQIIKSCSLSKAAKLTAVDNKYCRANFSACRKYEDASIGAIAACGKSTESLLLTAKRLKANFVILGNVMERTKRLFLSPNLHKMHASPSCPVILQINEEILNYVIENPLSLLDAEAIEDKSLVTSSAVPSICSSDDRVNLEFQLKLLGSAIKIIFNTLVGVQENLKRKYFFDSVLGFLKFITDEPSNSEEYWNISLDLT